MVPIMQETVSAGAISLINKMCTIVFEIALERQVHNSILTLHKKRGLSFAESLDADFTTKSYFLCIE